MGNATSVDLQSPSDQITAIEQQVRGLRQRLDDPAQPPLVLARDASALKLCLTIYDLITDARS